MHLWPISYTTLSDQAIAPTRIHESDAGFDLYSTQTILLTPGMHHCCMTDISIQFPVGYFWWIAPRSGLASKHALHVLGGIIDQWYTGNIGVILINLWTQAYDIKQGDRIAQLIIMPYILASLTMSQTLDTHSTRWDQGFGSSGI